MVHCAHFILLHVLHNLLRQQAVAQHQAVAVEWLVGIILLC